MKASPYHHCGVPLYELEFSSEDTRLFCGRFNTDWRFVVLCDGRTAQTGPYYRTMRELLDDSERFAAQYGLNVPATV